MTEIDKISERIEKGYTITRYGSREEVIKQLRADIEYLLPKAKHNEVLDIVSESEHNEDVITYSKNIQEFHQQINNIGANVKPYMPQTLKIVRAFNKIFLSSH